MLIFFVKIDYWFEHHASLFYIALNRWSYSSW